MLKKYLKKRSFDKITNQFHGQLIASSGLETFPLDSKKVNNKQFL